MRITRRNSLWMIPILAILTFPLWKIPVGAFLEPRGGFDPDFIKKTRVRHNFLMNGVTILQSEGGKQTASIKAVRARTGRRPNEFILDEVNADIIGGDGKLTNVVANTGNYNIERERLKLIDEVIITNVTEDYTMTTDLLYYDGMKLTVYCPGPTKIEGNGILVNGTSLGYDINKGTYTVGGRVLCTLSGFDKG